MSKSKLYIDKCIYDDNGLLKEIIKFKTPLSEQSQMYEIGKITYERYENGNLKKIISKDKAGLITVDFDKHGNYIERLYTDYRLHTYMKSDKNNKVIKRIVNNVESKIEFKENSYLNFTDYDEQGNVKLVLKNTLNRDNRITSIHYTDLDSIEHKAECYYDEFLNRLVSTKVELKGENIAFKLDHEIVKIRDDSGKISEIITYVLF